MTHDRIWYLLGRKMANELLPEEKMELERLLQQHPDVSYAKEVLTQSWKDKQKHLAPADVEAALQRHKQRLLEVQVAEEAAIPATGRNKVFRLALRIGGVAAAVTMLFLAGRTWLGGRGAGSQTQPALQQLVTKTGSRTHLTLPDGTSVWLNAGSKLDYPEKFHGKTREVVLEGEAFFDVAKDAAHPFLVKTTACSIRVLGTSFNVRFYPVEEMATTSLVTGSVEVMIDKKVVRLQPNEKLSVPWVLTNLEPTNTNAGPAMPVVKMGALTLVKDNIMAETAWKDNKLAFKGLPLGEVAQRMERWYGAEIRFKNERKKSLSFTGVFEKESLTEALQALEMSGGFHFTKDKDNIYWIE